MPLQQIGVNDADGATFGSASTKKISFYGVTPVAQPAAAAQATITITWVTISSGFGFQTSDQVVSLIAAFKEVQNVLKTLGIWKGSA